MKIQLNSNGQIIDVPLRIAQRYINRGRAHIVKEKSAKSVVVEAELEYDGIEEISIKPKVKVKKKTPKGKTIEDKTIERQESTSEEIQEW